MSSNAKITADPLKRIAYLYIRQSTLRQVFENTESTHRQYDLRQRAIALGWPEERIEVIDCDQAHSAESATQRDGFQYLVSQVGLGRAGLVMGLEVSRLARNCADWHQLMQICALTSTNILDQDGLYDPSDFNDRWVLGLKATMSEAERHILRSRLQKGILSKAQRGELKMPLPIGLVYDPAQRVVLDPDQQVQQALHHFFNTFRRCSSAWSTVAVFRKEGLKFPRKQNGRGEVVWGPLRHGIALQTLRNPLYAGAFCFGRCRTWKDAQGARHVTTLPQEQWRVLIKEAHPGYITWDAFEENQQRLRQNQQAPACQRGSPPREGPGLLQGLVICGKCGRRMTVRYHQRGGQLSPNYLGQKLSVEDAQQVCQDVSGGVVDEAVGKLILQSVRPLALEVSLQVQQELQSRLVEVDRLRRQPVERAQYEADQARVRFMRVDPNNRLVADTLEGLWNEKLRNLAQAKEDYEKKRPADQQPVTPEHQQQQILALAQDVPKLWNDPQTSHRDRKRMARLLVEDVTLKREGPVITAQARFKGGAARVLTLPAPTTVGDLRRTKAEVVAEVDRLIENMTDSEIAAQLNQRGWRCSVNHAPFTSRAVMILRWTYKLTSRADRLLAKGMVDTHQAAELLRTKPHLVDYWRQQGVLRGVRLNDKKEYLYERPDAQTVQIIQQRTRLNRNPAVVLDGTHEV